MRIIVVTGATGTIGWATTKELLYKGYRVVMAVRNTKKAQALVNDLMAEYRSRVMVEQVNVADQDSILDFVNRLRQQQSIYALVNIAGIMENTFHSKDGYELTYLTNFFGPATLIREMLPLMEPQGAIISTLSLSAYIARRKRKNYERNERNFTRIGSYADSKMALALYMQQLAIEQQGRLRINGVDPGVVNSNLLRTMFIGRLGALLVGWSFNKPEDVAKAMVRAVESEVTNRVFRTRRTTKYPLLWRNAKASARLYQRVHGGGERGTQL